MQKKARLMTKVPDLKKALEMVKLLISKQGEEVSSPVSMIIRGINCLGQQMCKA